MTEKNHQGINPDVIAVQGLHKTYASGFQALQEVNIEEAQEMADRIGVINHAIKAIYRFELAWFFRTIFQSIASPVLSTSLYFIVFGSAIGSRMTEIEGLRYGAFIVPGLIMLSVLTESISNGCGLFSVSFQVSGRSPTFSSH